MPSKTKVRPQARKDWEINRVQELRRSNAAQPERNASKYNRNSARKQFQRGKWDV